MVFHTLLCIYGIILASLTVAARNMLALLLHMLLQQKDNQIAID